jgi:hypothetical protein
MNLADSNICNICGWEEDAVQELNPNYRGGANPDSLNERMAWWQAQTHGIQPVKQTA